MIDRYAQLEAMYALLPRTTCEGCGECCQLTEEDIRQGYVTMYPLFAVEFSYISEYVARALGEVEQKRIFGVQEERPRRCPFQDDAHGCLIYPVRPMTCRAYGILSSEEIDDTEQHYRDRIPDTWLDRFLRIERSTMCPKVRVVDTEMMARHIENLVVNRYVRKLIELSRGLNLFGGEQRRVLEEITGKSEIIVWTWGGYNALRSRSAAWMKDHLEAFWRSVKLAE